MSYLGGAKWYPARTAWAAHGDSLQSQPLGGMVWFDGDRCPTCRFLMIRY